MSGQYYRLFYLPEHYSDWRAERFNSYHNLICGNWMEIYKQGSRNPADYPLLQPEGKYTSSALDNFLRLSGNYQQGAIWNDDDRKKASQLDGVCAFKDLDSALRYANGAPSEGRAIVVFEGIWISDIPETDHEYSGVLVKPIRPISLKSLAEYRQTSNPIPLPAG